MDSLMVPATFSVGGLMPLSEVAVSPKRIPAQELNSLYLSLKAEQKDELLQCLLVAASRGGDAVAAVLEDALLVFSVEEVLRTIAAPETDDDKC